MRGRQTWEGRAGSGQGLSGRGSAGAPGSGGDAEGDPACLVVRPPGLADPEVDPDARGLTVLALLSQGTCGAARGSHPATRRAPAGNTRPTTCAACPWGPWTRSGATGAGGGRLPWGRGLGGGSGFLLWSPRCRLRGPPAAVGPGLQRVCVPGLGHRRQSPGEPKPEPGNCVSPHGCAAPGAHGAGLGLWHRGEQGWARGGCAGLGLRALRALGWEAPGRAPQESNRLEGWSLPLDPWQPRVTPLSPFRGAGITCPSGPVPPGPPGARPRRRPASGEGSWASPVGPRRWPVPRRRPPIRSAVEAASPHLEQV